MVRAVGVVNPVANQCWIRHFIPFQGDQTGAVDASCKQGRCWRWRVVFEECINALRVVYIACGIHYTDQVIIVECRIRGGVNKLQCVDG